MANRLACDCPRCKERLNAEYWRIVNRIFSNAEANSIAKAIIVDFGSGCVNAFLSMEDCDRDD